MLNKNSEELLNKEDFFSFLMLFYQSIPRFKQYCTENPAAPEVFIEDAHSLVIWHPNNSVNTFLNIQIFQYSYLELSPYWIFSATLLKMFK